MGGSWEVGPHAVTIMASLQRQSKASFYVSLSGVQTGWHRGASDKDPLSCGPVSWASPDFQRPGRACWTGGVLAPLPERPGGQDWMTGTHLSAPLRWEMGLRDKPFPRGWLGEKRRYSPQTSAVSGPWLVPGPCYLTWGTVTLGALLPSQQALRCPAVASGTDLHLSPAPQEEPVASDKK